MYQVRLLNEATQNLESLDKSIARRVLRKILWLVENIEKIDPKGLRADLSGLAKLREGDYRIIYQILPDEQIILIHFIGHRRDVYKAR